MNVQQSLVLGVIQGLTEFIPVSSTAHLILAPEILRIAVPPDPHTYYTIIQLGTTVALVLYFWREWIRMAHAAGRILRHRKVGADVDERMVQYVLLGSIPAGVIGLLFEKKIDMLGDPEHFRGAYLVIGSSLILLGLLMWWVDATSRKTRSLENLRLPDAWFVGFAQACALVPGVSRSGATITAGLFAALDREAAVRFSFLLSTPIMVAATAYKVYKAVKGSQVEDWAGIALATVVAGITGYFAIAFLLNWLRTRSVGFFALWRILIGGFAIGLYFLQSQK